MYTKKVLICKKCNGPRDIGRRICKKCKAAEAKERNRIQGRHNYGKGHCALCKTIITLWNKNQLFCRRCCHSSTSKENVTNQYQRAGGGGYCFKHRRIVETILGKKLTSNEIVHHIDENPNNNELSNLIVISRSLHVKLHYYLRIQRALLAKADNVNLEKCWDSLRVPMTTAWLETAGVKVIKLWEIGQSAAESLK